MYLIQLNTRDNENDINAPQFGDGMANIITMAIAGEEENAGQTINRLLFGEAGGAPIIEGPINDPGYTRSNLQLGQEMHRGYMVDEVIPGIAEKEFTDIPGIRPDFVDFNTRTIYELKPYNPRSIQQGINQLIKYEKLFNEFYPGEPWKIELHVY